MLKILRSILIIILVIFIITFSLKNKQPVKVSYYFGLETKELPLYIVIISSFLIGVIGGIIYSLPSMIKGRMEIRRKNRRIRELEEELQKDRDLKNNK